MNEFELIRHYFHHHDQGALLGIGDDAALLQPTPGAVLAVSADMLVAGRHFFADADPFLLGQKALAVNLSDLAAMGARPRWFLLSLALPQADPDWLRRFSQGLFSVAEQYETALVGGDTTRGPLNLSLQIIGEVPAQLALRRDQARPGDDIWVSGMLGEAAAGLRHLQGEWRLPAPQADIALARLHAPQPRVALGLALRGISRCAIDLSDGLLGDLQHICERSSCGAELYWPDFLRSSVLQVLDEAAQRRCMLAGGDDYELCFTAAPDRRTQIEALSRQLQLPLTRVGRIVRGSSVTLLDADGKPIPHHLQGFNHFDSP